MDVSSGSEPDDGEPGTISISRTRFPAQEARLDRMEAELCDLHRWKENFTQTAPTVAHTQTYNIGTLVTVERCIKLTDEAKSQVLRIAPSSRSLQAPNRYAIP